MKYADLQSKTEPELQAMLQELRIKLGKLRFELANKTLKDTSQVGKVRHDIARVLTVLKQQEKLAS